MFIKIRWVLCHTSPHLHNIFVWHALNIALPSDYRLQVVLWQEVYGELYMQVSLLQVAVCPSLSLFNRLTLLGEKFMFWSWSLIFYVLSLLRCPGVKLVTQLMPKLRIMELFLRSPLYIHGMVLYLSSGTTLLLTCLISSLIGPVILATLYAKTVNMDAAVTGRDTRINIGHS
jgi:hypothetical protein